MDSADPCPKIRPEDRPGNECASAFQETVDTQTAAHHRSHFCPCSFYFSSYYCCHCHAPCCAFCHAPVCAFFQTACATRGAPVAPSTLAPLRSVQGRNRTRIRTAGAC